MCGLFGTIGHNCNPSILRTLSLLNSERGNQSLGFFNSRQKILKRAKSIKTCLLSNEFSEFLDSPAWFIVGHTRQATRGKIVDKNAHPFQFGEIIGAHNGIVNSPASYAVDSQYLFDLLSKDKGYQQLGNVCGYWSLAWFDSRQNRLFLQCQDNELFYTVVDSQVYFSSESKHLQIATGQNKTELLTHCQTISFDCDGNRYKEKNLKHTAGVSWFDKSTTGNQTNIGTTKSKSKILAADETGFLSYSDLMQAESLCNEYIGLTFHEYSRDFASERAAFAELKRELIELEEFELTNGIQSITN